MRFHFSVIILLFLCISTFSQSAHNGIPFVKNYMPADYNGESQNWAIIQDNRGVMYFGNTKGILEYDGVNWNFIDPVNIRVAKKDDSGKIFVAGIQDYGYLQANKLGEVEFKSLRDLIKDKNIELNNFYSIATLNNKVYFSERSGRLHIYDYNNIEIVEVPAQSFQVAAIDNQIIICSKNGIYKLIDNVLKEVPNSDAVLGKIIVGTFKFNQKLYFVTRNSGLFFYNEQNQLVHWNMPSDAFVKSNQVYRATKVDDHHLAFGTVENGVLVVDTLGRPVFHVNTNNGMANHDHCAIYTDQNKNIWSGLENGISHIQINSPFTFFNQFSGLNNAAIYDIKSLDKSYYVATAQGIMVGKLVDDKSLLDKTLRFEYIKNNENRRVWEMFVDGNEMLAGYSNKGTYLIKNNKATLISANNTAKSFCLDESGKFLICIREHGGILILKKQSKTWKYHSVIQKKYMFSHLTYDNTNDLWWANINTHGLAKLSFNSQFDKIDILEYYGNEHRLPVGIAAPLKVNNSVVFGTRSGTYKYIPNRNTFLKSEIDQKFNDVFFNKSVISDDGSTVLLGARNNQSFIGVVLKENDDFTFDSIVNPLGKITPYGIKTAFIKDSNSMLIGCVDRMVSYNKSFNQVEGFKLQTHINSVEILKPQVEKVYAETIGDKYENIVFNFDFINNALRFRFASPYYDEPDKTKYKYRLIGYEDSWSEWTKKTEKEYSFLQKGTYIFEVKSKNIYGSESSTATFDFLIKAPWYNTWVAWIIYIALVALLTRMVIWLSVRSVQNEKIKLEKVVAERTQELALQRDEILGKNETLEQQKKELSHQYKELSTHRQKTLDSLKYAEQIQQSLLTTKEKFEAQFDDNFILFKPKDIVSGDFYWLRQVDDKVLFAAADCTGHGIPGAFMSVLGISLINDIVSQNNVQQPSEILEKLRIQVKQSLKQESGESRSKNYIETYLNSKVRDGIDIAFCFYNIKNNTLTYSGANLPALIIRKGELIELNPVENPIGIYLSETPFTNTEIKLQKGDALYLFSDGYYDQFGGSENRKFYYNNFKKLLTEVHQLEMKKQLQKITETIENWQGINEQIDDIMVMGFRF